MTPPRFEARGLGTWENEGGTRGAIAVRLVGSLGRLEIMVSDGDGRTGVITDDQTRRGLIRALGGVPADETHDPSTAGRLVLRRCWLCGGAIDPLSSAFMEQGSRPMHATCPRDRP